MYPIQHKYHGSFDAENFSVFMVFHRFTKPFLMKILQPFYEDDAIQILKFPGLLKTTNVLHEALDEASPHESTMILNTAHVYIIFN